MAKKLIEIELSNICPDPNQPRKFFDQDELIELASSIEVAGLIQPINIRKNPEIGGAEFMIVAGERRYQAHKLLNKPTIMAIYDDEVDDEVDVFAQQLTENLHRSDLNAVEKADFVNSRLNYLRDSGVSNAVEKVAQEIGVSKSWVSKTIAILKYPEELRVLARNGLIKDYELIKRLNKLSGKKRLEAINLIEKGEFVAKDFFARKRYDKPKNEPESTQDPVDNQEGRAVKSAPKKSVSVSLKVKDLISIISKTDFCLVMDREQNNWKELMLNDPEYAKGIAETFIKFCQG